MEFKLELDMTKVVKIVIDKDENSFIEYSIKDGAIVDASIIKKEKTIEEKVDDLKKNNEDVKKINQLIDLNYTKLLSQMNKTGKDKVFDVVKETIEKEPISVTYKEDTAADDNNDNEKYKTPLKEVKEAREIMRLDKKMDEIAKENREKIAENMLTEIEYKTDVETSQTENKVALDKALEINDRNERIAYLKKMITDLQKQ